MSATTRPGRGGAPRADGDRPSPPGRAPDDRGHLRPFRLPEDPRLRAADLIDALPGLSPLAKLVARRIDAATFGTIQCCWHSNDRLRDLAGGLEDYQLNAALRELEEYGLIRRLLTYEIGALARLREQGFTPHWEALGQSQPRRAIVLLYKLPPGDRPRTAEEASSETAIPAARRREHSAGAMFRDGQLPLFEDGAGAMFAPEHGAGAILNMAPALCSKMAPAPCSTESLKEESPQGNQNVNAAPAPDPEDDPAGLEELARTSSARAIRNWAAQKLRSLGRPVPTFTPDVPTEPAPTPRVPTFRTSIPTPEERGPEPRPLGSVPLGRVLGAARTATPVPDAEAVVATLAALSNPTGPEAVEQAVQALAGHWGDRKARSLEFYRGVAAEVTRGVLTAAELVDLFRDADCRTSRRRSHRFSEQAGRFLRERKAARKGTAAGPLAKVPRPPSR